MIQVRTFARSLVRYRTWSAFLDIAATLLGFALLFYAVVFVARYWFGNPVPVAEISRSPKALPAYAFYSLVRIFAAYFLSLLFALGYGYIAAYNRRLEAPMIAVLDILQSIPVLSFLPGVMLAMVALFPTRQLGLELGSIILIFTGQVWNMAFSFYSSLKNIPRELREATRIYRFSPWQRFFQLELPYSAIGLVWNSMVSVAGGWFFLMACEMFVLGNRDFRLPGLGSYLQTAASAGDTSEMIWGLAAMIAVILLLDQLVWRPLIAWSDKFKFEQVESSVVPRSPLIAWIKNSRILGIMRKKWFAPLSERLVMRFAHRSEEPTTQEAANGKFKRIAGIVLAVAALGAVVYALIHSVILLGRISSGELELTVKSAIATFLRVTASLLIASAWTIPTGVAIGFHPRLARIAQPLAQIAASIPATALFPVLLVAIVRLGGGLGIGSILLMLLGTQWYILFNVIAGALAIPSDLREVGGIFRFSNRERWMTVILPGIFPYLLTGLVTASGGAWNASIVAEYFHLKDQTYSTLGLGAQISRATDTGNFHLLLLSTVVMAGLVVTVNRLLWKPLFRLAENRYRLDV
ncbi:MAG TPA: ABC transporter permease subunit [Terriglobales bacterium]|nr:ABC transporter permease subunit [Terriglobales bacterium]